MREFNQEETVKKILPSAFDKVGQNPFADNIDIMPWLDSLTENALYKSLLDCAEAVDLK